MVRRIFDQEQHHGRREGFDEREVREQGHHHHDRRTEEVIAAILASGEAFFGGTTWRGRRAMRVSVSCWLTSKEDVRRVVMAVAQVLNVEKD